VIVVDPVIVAVRAHENDTVIVIRPVDPPIRTAAGAIPDEPLCWAADVARW
jgi:hypothetical protein